MLDQNTLKKLSVLVDKTGYFVLGLQTQNNSLGMPIQKVSVVPATISNVLFDIKSSKFSVQVKYYTPESGNQEVSIKNVNCIEDIKGKFLFSFEEVVSFSEVSCLAGTLNNLNQKLAASELKIDKYKKLHDEALKEKSLIQEELKKYKPTKKGKFNDDVNFINLIK